MTAAQRAVQRRLPTIGSKPQAPVFATFYGASGAASLALARGATAVTGHCGRQIAADRGRWSDLLAEWHLSVSASTDSSEKPDKGAPPV